MLPDPAPDLVNDIRQGSVVGVIGSGLSCAVGLPGWVELLQGICDEAWGTKPARRQDIAWAFQDAAGRPLDAANLLKQTVLGPDFAGALARQLLRRRKFEPLPQLLAQATGGQPGEKPWKLLEGPTDLDPVPSASHRMLVQFGLRCFVTTNYDDLLEAAADSLPAYSWSSADVPARLAAHTPLVLKIHGDLDHPRDIIVTRADYAGPYATSPTRQALGALIKSSRPLWIGYGHNDPDLDLFLDEMQRLGITGGYAIVSEITPPLRRRLADVDISVAELPRHADVPRFLQRLGLALGKPVTFSIQFTTPCPDDKTRKSRNRKVEDALESHGVQADVRIARNGSNLCQIEVAPDDFRGLRSLLSANDVSLLGALGALGVQQCDGVTIPTSTATPPPPPPSSPPAPPPITPPIDPPIPPTPAIAVYLPSGPPALALADLLLRLFDTRELREWILEVAAERFHDIEFVGPYRGVCVNVSEVLERHGQLTRELLAALRRKRPGRAHEVDALERHLFPPPPPPDQPLKGERYTLFCRLLDRDHAWQTLARACEDRDVPLVFLLHGTPHQNLSLFMDRARDYLDDEDQDGVKRVHRVFEVPFEKNDVRLQTVEEWEPAFRRGMGLAKGKSFTDCLARELGEHAVLFLVRGNNNAPLSDLTPVERAALGEFLTSRLPAIFAALPAPHRAVRVLVGIEHPHTDHRTDVLCKEVVEAVRRADIEHKRFELHFPTIDETLDSVDKFLKDRHLRLTPALTAQLEAVYNHQAARGDARNYRDLADALYAVLDPLLAARRP